MITSHGDSERDLSLLQKPDAPKRHQHRRRRQLRVCCYVSGCVFLLLLLGVVVLVLFFLVFLKPPEFTFQKIQTSSSSPSWMDLKDQEMLMHLDLVYAFTNPNAFALDFYDVRLSVYSEASYFDRLGLGQLSTLHFPSNTTTPQLFTFPMTFNLSLPWSSTSHWITSTLSNLLFNSPKKDPGGGGGGGGDDDEKDPVKAKAMRLLQQVFETCRAPFTQPWVLYYQVELGLTWFKFTGFKHTFQGKESVTCPVDLLELLKSQPPFQTWLQPLLQRLPELSKDLLQNAASVQPLVEKNIPVQDLLNQVKPFFS
ncbi:hypothetical protein HMI54_000822 [Coelomomyces lativittatus]|nr:hypothetical protein HMI54_000822 [Coelomomyces lativittatus]KAJ1513628.1 hypothetical protein HMI56_002074 [Coelomomyces lativittatus]KAJ1518197.1 hypothetical protein HMI55_001690 [Coelomomyces lativittatus]